MKTYNLHHWSDFLSTLSTLNLILKNQELKRINVTINSVNLNHKINFSTNLYIQSGGHSFFSLGSTLVKFNILQKSFRRNKKYVNILINSLRTKLNWLASSVVKSKKVIKTKFYLSIYGPNQSFIILKDLSLFIDIFDNQSGSFVYIKPLVKNSNNYFKKVKAIKKRIKKKLIKKFYKN
jgi:hypothetical protein